MRSNRRQSAATCLHFLLQIDAEAGTALATACGGHYFELDSDSSNEPLGSIVSALVRDALLFSLGGADALIADCDVEALFAVADAALARDDAEAARLAEATSLPGEYGGCVIS